MDHWKQNQTAKFAVLNMPVGNKDVPSKVQMQ